MKKRLLTTVLMLIVLLAFAPAALADEEVKVTITASPSEMSEGGSVAFSFEVANYSIYEVSDVTATCLGNVYDLTQGAVIAPYGSVRQIELTLQVSEGQLGQPIVFTINCIRGGEPISQEVSVTIARAEVPTITVTRTAASTMARQGESITLTYTIKNDTKFDMQDITLLDNEISDGAIIKQDSLRAGDSFSLDRQYTMGADNVTSAPVVTYKVNGKERSFSGIEPVTLKMMLVQLKMDVSAGTPTTTGVQFSLDVKNTGNLEIRDISIADERGNPVNAEPFSLKTGESLTVPYQVVPLMSEPLRNVQFVLKGTDEIGQAYELKSAETYPVYPFVDESQINVAFTAETVTPWSAESGKVVARIRIINHSQIELKNVTVSETAVGVLKSYDLLAAGETTFDQEIALGSPRNLQFTLKGSDPTGAARQLGDCTLMIAYGAEETASMLATPTPAVPEGNGAALGFLSSTISKILLVLGILMVVAFVVLIVLSFLDRSRNGRVRLDRDSFRRYDDDEDDEDEYGEDEDELDRLFNDEPAARGGRYRDDEARYYSRRTPRDPSYRYEREADVDPSGRLSRQPVRQEPARTADAVIQLPSPQPSRQNPAVPVEYEEDDGYGDLSDTKRRDLNSAAAARRSEARWAEDAPQTVYAYRQAAFTYASTPASGPSAEPAAAAPAPLPEEGAPYYGTGRVPLPDDGMHFGAPVRTPKIIETKQRPVTHAERKNAIRHVRTEDDDNRD